MTQDHPGTDQSSETPASPPKGCYAKFRSLSIWTLLVIFCLILGPCVIWGPGFGGQHEESLDKQFSAHLGTQGWEALGGYYDLSVYRLAPNGEHSQLVYHLKIPCSQKCFAPMREVRSGYLDWQEHQLTVKIPHEHPVTIDLGTTNPPPVYR